ncbi:MAG: Gfo/Idh/MocA family oxidoreductase [Candidatus Marinimicrobia bacterium]|nr:Gfo/Idh/MocA family oxidoreductase [Candidatus Neomarinimicrobiota bacterium]
MSVPTVAIIGAGSRGLHCYGGYLERHPEAGRVVAVADPRAFYREEAARRHGIPAANQFADWRELLARPRLADAVIIATTDRLHYEPALAAAAQGYHILLEKPMAPTPEECAAITRAAQEAGIVLMVCHVLRYASFYNRIREILEAGTLGDLVSIQHLEGIAWWHFAHSFVRGNFGNESRSSFSLLAKCCHDIDLLRWWADRPCRRVSSFGSLHHFRADQAPAGSTARCLDCPLADGACPYSAKAFYFGRLRQQNLGWPLNMVVENPDEDRLTAALRTGPYGRCVYRCDNDVVDNQVVNFEFAGGVSASLTMSAFTPHGRRVKIMGAQGYLEGDEQTLRVLDFKRDAWTEEDVNKLGTDLSGGHGGGDQRMMAAFMQVLATGDRSLLRTGPEVSLESHRMVFAAEQSRLEGRTVTL